MATGAWRHDSRANAVVASNLPLGLRARNNLPRGIRLELWIPITIIAAFLQNLRSVGQKHLKAVMGTTGATFVRFGFGLPFALLYVALLHRVVGYALPTPSTDFFGWVVVGGLMLAISFPLSLSAASGRSPQPSCWFTCSRFAISRSAPPIRAPSRRRRRCSACCSSARR